MLVRYSPRSFNPTQSLMDDMRRTFGMFFDGYDLAAEGTWAGVPRFESTTLDDGVTIRAEIPGVAPEQLNVAIEGDRLIVEANAEASAPEGYEVRRQERPVARWKQSLALPFEVDADKVKAKLEHGTLELWLPKAERIKPRQIQING